MGKKKRKERSSLLSDSASNSTLNDGDTSCSSLNFSNISLDEETTVPSKFLVSTVEFAHCELYAKCLKSDWENVIFLHPSVMTTYSIEHLVLIQDENTKRALCVAHPLRHIKKSVVVFPKHNCNFQSEDLVNLQPYNVDVKDAQEVFISVCDKNVNIDQYVKKIIFRLLVHKYIFEGLVIKWKLFDQDYEAVVKGITCSRQTNSFCPSEFYTISYKTILKFESHILPNEWNTSAFAHIGGLEKQVKKITKYIQMFLSAENFSLIFCGTLMFLGPPGTGKSLLLNAIYKEYNICIKYIQWYRICAMSQAEVTRELRSIFDVAIDRAPSIIIIDDFNHLCPSIDNDENILQCIKQTLKHLLETLGNAKVLILAAANNSNYEEYVLKSHKRFIEIVDFRLPSSDERVDILKKLLDLRNHELTYEQIQECAELAHGFTGKDLLDVTKDAQMHSCKRRYYDILNTDEGFNSLKEKDLVNEPVKFLDLKLSTKLKKPTIVEATDLKVKKVQWADIGGMSDVKEKLKQVVEWPLKYPEAFRHFNITPSRGVLMYGPPGCSKTMIAKALATECELNFISKNASDLYDKYVGESERAVRDLFAMAKAKSPCIIFLDEIDALVNERGSSSSASGVGDRIVTTLLTEMDGIEELHGVIIIAATNRPDMLDEALVRNGRINHFIYVSLPDAKTREEILRISMRNRISEKLDFKLLSEKTEEYSGAEIVNICNEAALLLLAEEHTAEFPIFRMHHFEEAMKQVLPRTSKEIIEFYENFNKKHCIDCN